jgi:hypothetical protein
MAVQNRGPHCESSPRRRGPCGLLEQLHGPWERFVPSTFGATIFTPAPAPGERRGGTHDVLGTGREHELQSLGAAIRTAFSESENPLCSSGPRIVAIASPYAPTRSSNGAESRGQSSDTFRLCSPFGIYIPYSNGMLISSYMYFWQRKVNDEPSGDDSGGVGLEAGSEGQLARGAAFSIAAARVKSSALTPPASCVVRSTTTRSKTLNHWGCCSCFWARSAHVDMNPNASANLPNLYSRWILPS